jgi:DNA-3-methyladenine glycosylase
MRSDSTARQKMSENLLNGINATKLPREFYIRDTLRIARELLGKIFVRKIGGKTLAGRIVETEAYIAGKDESAHSSRGKTKRNATMFEEGGVLYVYFTYGMYHCANVVTGEKEEGNAVLLRAIEPLEGIEAFAFNRFGKTEITEKEKRNLLSGPGKICMAYGLTKKEDGTDLLGDEIFILDVPPLSDEKIVQTTRIGISKSKDFPWRFYEKDNPYVSKK